MSEPYVIDDLSCLFCPFFQHFEVVYVLMDRESVAGSVIQATGMVEFENGLRMVLLLGGCWCPWGGRIYPRINFKPLLGCRLVLGWLWLSEGPLISDQIPTCLVPRIGGIKLQLLFGVRIEPML